VSKFAAITTSLALIGALFFGTPAAVYAVANDIYVGSNDDATGASSCADPDFSTDDSDEAFINIALDLALAAIDNDADTIIICDGEYTYVADIPLHNVNLEDDDPRHDVIKIEAAPGADVTFDGQDGFRFLRFDNVTSVSVTGINFANGETTDYGAAIQVYIGTLSVIDSTFTGNTAERGGAIYSEPGHVTISGSDFTNNEASNEGGALAVQDPADGEGVTVTDSNFTGNSQAEGAAISVNGAASSAIIEVTDSEFVNNDGHYGAVTIDGGTVELTNVLMDGNNNAWGSGGAVYAGNGFTATNSRFLNNSVIGDDGGAVYSSGPLIVINSVFTGNQALGDGEGGAIHAEGVCGESASITRSTFINNVAESSAGAINVDCDSGDVILLARNTFTGNTSNVAGAVDQDGSGQLLIFQRNVFTANRAIGDEAEGGALWVSNATFSGNRFSRNRSDVYGGAVYATNSTVGRAALRSQFGGNRARRGPDVYYSR
jgi:predicted outer membrane repeat protein